MKKTPTPPRWADRLLEWRLPDRSLEEVQGDLHERFHRRAKVWGEKEARRQYVWEVLGYLKPGRGMAYARQLDRNDYSKPNYSVMLRNYFTVAWRNFSRNKAFSAINTVGLAFGLASSLFILLWVQDERGVDAFHAHKDQLYRIYMREHFSGKVQGVIWTPGPLFEELKRSVPEIQYATAYSWTSPQTFALGDKVNKQLINVAGADFFNMFSFPLLQGSPETALKDRDGLAISRRMAEIFFGSPEAAMGKTIRFDNRMDLRISAVFENIPRNSTLQFDCLRNWEAYVEDGNEWAKDWESTDPLTFFMMRPDADPAQVAAKIRHLLDKFNRDEGKPTRTELAMQPFHEYYLNSNFKNAQIDGGRIEYVRLFSWVAIFILLIACINFMNLATARSSKRAKEVGIRKVAGAVRSVLIKQFVGEAVLLAFLSVGLAILIVSLLLPSFNALTDKQLTLPVQDLSFWCMLVGVTFLTGLVAGSYPAFFLSSLSPIRVLKGESLQLKFDAKSTCLRQGLVVFQFSLSIVLMISMIVIYQQVEYIQHKNLGFDRENLIYFPLEGNLVKNFEVLKTELTQVPGIRSVSHMTESPASNGHGTEAISWAGSDPNDKVRFTPVGVGYDFVKTMNLQLVAGREYSKQFQTDSVAFLINETALKTMGFKDPIGQTINWGQAKGTIIGVVKDFHFQSLHTPIRPLITYLRGGSPGDAVLVRIGGGHTTETLAQIEKICRKLNPDFPFTYQFTDQAYAWQYRSELVTGQLSGYFALLAIFISCLGLFGLAAFTAEQRTKEIGVRKVLGASVTDIVALLSRDFLKLVLISIVIASPLAWYFMQRWLQNFAYKIDMAWWVFALAGLVAIGIALLTVSFQSIKAALMNPVKSLRTE